MGCDLSFLMVRPYPQQSLIGNTYRRQHTTKPWWRQDVKQTESGWLSQSSAILIPTLDNLSPWPYYDGVMNANMIQTGSSFSARLGRGGLVFALLVVAVL
jgi:hypothetical protein